MFAGCYIILLANILFNMDTSSYLFVYGTLLSEGNEFAAFLMENSTLYGDGKFKGELYDIGEYPGAIVQPLCDHYVHGQVFLMNQPDMILRRLDDYEGFGDGQPEPNEFIRTLTEVETDINPLNCWVYLYQLPTDGLWHIRSGNYLEYAKIS
jgi:gamma-glutamylcyclotransferase (GGCT)/AIG2-like uncharacterized protein YtfP